MFHEMDTILYVLTGLVGINTMVRDTRLNYDLSLNYARRLISETDSLEGD